MKDKKIQKMDKVIELKKQNNLIGICHANLKIKI